MASNGFTEAQNLLLEQIILDPHAEADEVAAFVAAHFRAENSKLTAHEEAEIELLCAEGETHEEQNLHASAELSGDAEAEAELEAQVDAEIAEARKHVFGHLDLMTAAAHVHGHLGLPESEQERLQKLLDLAQQKAAPEDKGAETKRRRGAPPGPRAEPTPECRCMARVAGTGHDQCKNSRHAKHGEFCATHGKQCLKNPNALQFDDEGKRDGLFLGRIDQPIPNVDEKGYKCVTWDGEELTGFVMWHPATPEGIARAKATARAEKRSSKETEKLQKKAEKAAAKTAKLAEMAAAKAKKPVKLTKKQAAEPKAVGAKASKRKVLKKPVEKRAVNAYFVWLNAPGTRDSIKKQLATKGVETTVANVTKEAGRMWNTHFSDEMKSGWKRIGELQRNQDIVVAATCAVAGWEGAALL